jgi:acyl-CoA oxidase
VNLKCQIGKPLLQVTRLFNLETQLSRNSKGGKGYLSLNRIDALKNDTPPSTHFEGDNTVLMQLVAKPFVRISENPLKWIMINYVYESAKNRFFLEKNPIITRKRMNPFN